jgi:hypothetical protein
MIQFKLIQDWYIQNFFEKVKIYDAGHIFSAGEDGFYQIESQFGNMKMDESKMREAINENGELLFKEITNQSINISSYEVEEEKDLEIKSWRIQLDVKTSLRNLKKIEAFIKENISEYL